MPNFLKFLKKEGSHYLFSRSLFALVIGFISWPVFLYILDVYDSVVPLKENSAFNWVILTVALALSIFVYILIRSWFKKPTFKQIAKHIENADPDLLDLLNCAVELEEVSKTRELSFMEKRVLERTEKASEIAWHEGIRPKPKSWGFLFIGFVSGFIFTAFNLSSSPLQKSIDSFSDEPGLFLFTTKTGSSLNEEFPASHEFVRGTDISVLPM